MAQTMPLRTRGRIAAIMKLRCPRCREGRLFRGLFAMPDTCPVCHLKIEREPGYFVGAMYISYAIEVPLVLILAGGVGLAFPNLSPAWVIGSAMLLSLPLVPAVFRYSRTLWMHLDRSIDRGA
jgi:uncharacterized protein (DUF983 family)